jgi:alkylated DNA repair dioxygenase AlkB
MAQQELFETTQRLPEGFQFEREFVSAQEEASLVAAIADLPLEEARYKDYTAKRRTVSYGYEYDFGRNALDTAPGMPDFLLPLRGKVARWLDLPAEAFVHALVSEYRTGTPLGWHRDVPNFEAIAGVSLGGPARMRLRPYRPGERNRRQDVIALELAPRSAYSMRGIARWGWQHSIAPTPGLRYSITFRTARR